MAQIFDRSSNALARMSLILTGLIVIALGVSLDQLQQIQVYPQDPVQVAELYETSEKLIRFIMTELPRERFTQFLRSVLSGHTLAQALSAVYGDKLASYADFEKKYARFNK